MRTELKKRLGLRQTYLGTVERFGLKSSYRGPPKKTVLLVHITDTDGHPVTDHLWLTVGKRLKHLQVGNLVQFDARVTSYLKGYRGRRDDIWEPLEEDYRLSYPTNIKIVQYDKKKEPT